MLDDWDQLDRLTRGVDAAAAALFNAQRPDGSWSGRLSAAASASGTALTALQLIDPIGSVEHIDRAVDWLVLTQAGDGGWGEDVQAPATTNATVLALAGLSLVASDRSDDARSDRAAQSVVQALAKIEALGGIAALGDRSHCSLGAVGLRLMSLSGLYDESALSRVPLELALMPRGLRSKLSFTVPGVMSWGVMDARLRPGGPVRRRLHRLAERRALAYLDELVEFDGPVGGFEESPLMSACVAIGLHRAGVRPDIVAHCLDYIRSTQRDDGSWSVNRDLEIPISAYVAIGLHDAGYGLDPRLTDTPGWFRDRQREAMPAVTGAPAGGWGWAYPSGWPNTGDTTATMLALQRFGLSPDDPAITSGTDWLLGMQNRDGSWGCFTRNAKLSLDAPCTVMTADAVSTLHDVAKLPAGHPAIQRAVAWFTANQKPDGSLPCRWYVGHTAGTAGALRVLNELGLGDGATARRCADWLRSAVNSDGGWGSDLGEPSAPELTAWTMLALLASSGYDPADAARLRAAAGYLLDTQRPDGLWTPSLYGIYFLDLLYASDHHANGHALQALARYRSRQLVGQRPEAENQPSR